MNEKIGVIASIGIALIVVVTLGFSLLPLVSGGNLSESNLLMASIVLILVALTSIILWNRWKSLKEGFPVKDERLERINYKAGFYAFIAAMWSAVMSNLIGSLISGYELTGEHVVAIVVLVSGLVFVGSFLYLSRKGRIE